MMAGRLHRIVGNSFMRSSLSSISLHNTAAKSTSSATTPKRLTGKVAIVTASTDGIGYAIAQRLAEEGASVMVSSRKQKNVDSAVARLRSGGLAVEGCVCHVGKSDHRKALIKQTVEKFGGIDILVSNAAANPAFGPILETKEDAWDKIFDTNVKAAFFLCQEAIPYMEERGGGSIMFVSSIAAYVPFELIAAYSVSKTALLGLVKALTPQCASLNIRVNGIAPGIVETRFSDALISNDYAKEKVLEGIPLKRVAQPQDISGTAAFLASDDSAYITGETMLVTGGMTARL